MTTEKKANAGSTREIAAGESTPRRFYRLWDDLKLPGKPWHVWQNEAELMREWPGDHAKPFLGLVFSEPPRIAFDKKVPPARLRDAYSILATGVWLVSDRLRQVMTELDPGAFVFEPTEVDYGNLDEPGPGFWFCDTRRWLDCVDEERSELTYYDNVPFKSYRKLIDVRMKLDVVGEAHAFRLQHAPGIQIVDDVAVAAFHAAGIKGYSYESLQT